MRCYYETQWRPVLKDKCQQDATHKLIFHNGVESLVCDIHIKEVKYLRGTLIKSIEPLNPDSQEMTIYRCDKCGEERDGLEIIGDEQVLRCICGGIFKITKSED